MRRYFDPAAYHIVLFDQRNCSHSTPHASDPATDLRFNTTEHLLQDIEQLRQHLGIERWLVFGGSWGSTLALAYAKRQPEQVTEIVLVGVTTTRRSEINWLYHGVAPLFPAEWSRFQAGIPVDQRTSDLVADYYRLLNHPDQAVRNQAAMDWVTWEDSHVFADPTFRPEPPELEWAIVL